MLITQIALSIVLTMMTKAKSAADSTTDGAAVVNRLTTLLHTMFKAIDSNDWESLEPIFHQNIVYQRGGYEPFRGIDRVMKFYRQERILASGRHNLEGVVVDGDRGACWGRFEGQKKDGGDVVVDFADVYLFANNKIVFRKSHFFVSSV